MNRLPIVLACTLVLAACASLPSDITPVSGAPTYAPSVKVPDVLERAPAKAYVQIGTIDAKGVSGMTAEQLRTRIRTQAQNLGADAVVLQDASTRAPAESKFNPATGAYETRPGEVIPAYKGIAIKYQS